MISNDESILCPACMGFDNVCLHSCNLGKNSDYPNRPNTLGKTPHKCPVCNGTGKVGIRSTPYTGNITDNCHACSGKGVLWG